MNGKTCAMNNQMKLQGTLSEKPEKQDKESGKRRTLLKGSTEFNHLVGAEVAVAVFVKSLHNFRNLNMCIYLY